MACPESKDETHFLPLPLFVRIAEFDPADQCVGCSMSVRTEMLCDGKTRRILVNALEMFTKTFPQSVPSLRPADKQVKGSLMGKRSFWPQKIGFAGNMVTSTGTWVLT